jgi:hypothetical protein
MKNLLRQDLKNVNLNGSLIKQSKKSDDNVYSKEELEGEDLFLINNIADDKNPIEIGSSCGELFLYIINK